MAQATWCRRPCGRSSPGKRLSVYTTVDAGQLAHWLEPLGVGAPDELSGIAAGMQNSNYFVVAGGQRWVLTIFETLAAEQLDFYLALQQHLALRGIPCPHPQALPGAIAQGGLVRRFW